MIYASDWPVLRMRRVVPEALALDLPADVLDNYLYNNAHEFFFGRDRRSTDDGPLRTAQAGLQPVRGPPGDLQEAYKQFFKTHCPIETVRAAEESGFDKSLWERLCAMGATTMALPESRRRRRGDAGRPDAGGRGDRPVAGAGAVDRPCVRGAAAGPAGRAGLRTSSTASSSPRSIRSTTACRGVRLIPTGSIADQIIVRDGDDIVRLTFGTRPAKVDNIGRLPMAWVDPAAADSRTVLASGADALAEYQRALDEWRVLTAAALVGLVEETMTIAAEFAKTRYTLGVPISTLQGISHPLANIAITVQGGRNLARRAAWFLDNEPDERPELAPSAFVFMAEEASKAATMAVQVQGGLGVSAEAAATAYLVRARGWALAGGDPGASAKYIAEIVAARESGREGRIRWISHGSSCPTRTRRSSTRPAHFLRTHVTDDVLRRDRETGDNFDEGVHLALGEAGYLAREWKPESEGGFNRVRRRIWELEKRRAHVPWVTLGTTAMIARSVEKFGSPELKAEVMPRVFSGQVRLCLGYTEPEGGSDVATCKTRAVRDGDGWVINGSKMFTTGAHNCQYVFLITNTDPDAPKHKSLTMFLVPLDSPGIEIQGIRTVDGDRTNIVYYSDVRVDDKYRLGEVNAGWTVVREPLNVEHGAVAAARGRPCRTCRS